jgi:hypothetical protein
VDKSSLHFDSFWTRHIWLLSLLVGVCFGVFRVGLDLLFLKAGLQRTGMLTVSNSIAGLLAACFFYFLASREKKQREMVRERMETVAELNHHIRNALQVIKFWGGTKPEVDTEHLQSIKDSVQRIEWALREVLPRYQHSEDKKVAAPASGSESRPFHEPSNQANGLISQRKQIYPH